MRKDFDQEFSNAITDPVKMEELFHENQKAFSKKIKSLAINEESQILNIWKARIFYKPKIEPKYVIIYILMGIFFWLPWRGYIAYEQNKLIADVLLYSLPSIFALCWGFLVLKKESKSKKIYHLLSLAVLIAFYLILIPKQNTQSSILATIYCIPMFWLYIMYFSSEKKNIADKISYISKTGEIIIWSSLFILGGILLSIITFALFSAIEISIEDFYLNNIVTLGLCIAPFLGTYFAYNEIESKISKTISTIFSPIFAGTIAIFLIAALTSVPKLLNNRESFIIYSFIPVVVMAIIVLTNIGIDKSKIEMIINLSLAVFLVLFCSLAIFAVIYRIVKWGITPNKANLCGLEILIFFNSIRILIAQIKLFGNKQESMDNIVIKTMPSYFIWSAIVIFIMPIVFSFK